MENITVLGILILERQNAATEVQKILTEYGCSIKTRVGLHEVSTQVCSNYGMILLELFGADEEKVKLEEALLKVSGVKVQKMVF